MKISKEELTKKVGELEAQNRDLREMDGVIRRNFARFFDWQKKSPRGSYFADTEYVTPNWSDIYVEVGRLLERNKHLSALEHVEALEAKFANLSQAVEEKLNPSHP